MECYKQEEEDKNKDEHKDKENTQHQDEDETLHQDIERAIAQAGALYKAGTLQLPFKVETSIAFTTERLDGDMLDKYHHVRWRVDLNDHTLWIAKLPKPPHQAAVFEFTTQMGNYACTGNRERVMAVCGGQKTFGAVSHDPDVAVSPIRGPDKGKHCFIVEFEHAHRTGKHLAPLATEYFASPVVKGVLFVQAYVNGYGYDALGNLQAAAVLFLREGDNVVRSATCDIGCSPLSAARKASYLSADHPAFSVPVDAWDRNGAALEDEDVVPLLTYAGGSPTVVVPHGLVLVVPEEMDDIEEEDMEIDMGRVLWKFAQQILIHKGNQ